MAARRLTRLAWGFTVSCFAVGAVLAYVDRGGDAFYAFLIGGVSLILAIALTTRAPAPQEDGETQPRRGWE